EPQLRLSLHLAGEPASADSRQQYRVCTVLMDKVAVVGDEPACPLLDMSIGGFAIMSERDYRIGDLLPVTLSDDEREFSGIARVQSMREMQAGSIRYGFLCVDETDAPGSLKQGLRELTMAYQREQLARQAVHN
ncbi:MAG: PilZ domain-containing protein, partial [Phycisphaerae bacterium]|nr:PilZ domain-containing protein [Phycisphaerae bacterium]